MSDFFANSFASRPFDSNNYRSSNPSMEVPGSPFPNKFRDLSIGSPNGRPSNFSRFDSMSRNALPGDFNRNRSTSFSRTTMPFRATGPDYAQDGFIDSLLQPHGVRRDILMVLLIALIAAGLWAYYYFWCQSQYDRRTHGHQCACRTCKRGVKRTGKVAESVNMSVFTSGSAVVDPTQTVDTVATKATVRNPFHANAAGTIGTTKTTAKAPGAARRSCRI